MRQSETENTSWRKSSFSGSGEHCVEIARSSAACGIRDSKAGAGSPALLVSGAAFDSFLSRVASRPE